MTFQKDLFDGKTVLVTGGTQGIGAGIAQQFAALGARVIAAGIAPTDAQREALGPRIEVAPLDVSDDASVAALLENVPSLDVLVNCAGMIRRGDEHAIDVFERVIAVNLLGTAAVVRAALPALYATHGRVVTVSSSLGVHAVSDATAYSASKFGVIGFSRALTAETRGQIGVTTLIPAGMKTRFFDGRTAQYAPGEDANLNDPANVAAAVVFALSSPRGSEIRELSVMHEEEPSWP